MALKSEVKRVLVGIDPGKFTGVAISMNGKLFLHTVGVLDVISTINAYIEEIEAEVKIYMEDPNLNKPVFKRAGQSVRAMQKIAQNTGSNKRDAQILYQMLTREGFTVYPVRPGKNSMTKLSAERFNTITEYSGKSSEHSRDAAMLIYGR